MAFATGQVCVYGKNRLSAEERLSALIAQPTVYFERETHSRLRVLTALRYGATYGCFTLGLNRLAAAIAIEA